MKKLIIFALIIIGAWKYYSESFSPKQGAMYKSLPAPHVVTIKNNFRCDGRQHCSQMNSRAEAVYFINNCPNTKMDGDRDGIPCENVSRF